jgi:hypothetical protein
MHGFNASSYVLISKNTNHTAAKREDRRFAGELSTQIMFIDCGDLIYRRTRTAIPHRL